MILDYKKEELDQLGATYTVSEIAQQPLVWNKVIEMLKEKKDKIHEFLNFINDNHQKVRVILTGAGTSAYVGETILPYLIQNNQYKNFVFESIATTDLVSAPYEYFQRDVPTLLVSFARSGNSPESVAAVQLSEQLVKSIYQLVITCNQYGHLAVNTKQDDKSLLLLMPEESNDKGFAMTSSFTSMLLTASLVFQINKISNLTESIKPIIEYANQFLIDHISMIDDISKIDFQRIVYLGSGIFTGLSRESALKMLELTSGKIMAVYESSLGFRHGPKSMLNDETVVVMFISSNPYTRKYDIDMLKEIYNEKIESKVVAVAQNPDSVIKNNCHYLIDLHINQDVHDLYLAFLFISFAQVLAMKKSISLGISPDNPSPNGMVNRVVKGVKIYPLIKK